MKAGRQLTCAPSSDTRRRSGVTLVELLVVFGILALTLSLALPALVGVRNRGREVVCLSNLNRLGETFSLYVDRRDGEYPFPSGITAGLGAELPPAPAAGLRGATIPFAQLESNWQFLLTDIARWERHFGAWVCPGSPGRSDEALWWREGGVGETLASPSYAYSLSFMASPQLWSGQAAEKDLPALLAGQRAADVRSPSQKVLMWDREMAHLTAPNRNQLDRRPMLFADGHAAVRRLSEAAAPAANPLTNHPHPLSHTPDGVQGRDY